MNLLSSAPIRSRTLAALSVVCLAIVAACDGPADLNDTITGVGVPTMAVSSGTAAFNVVLGAAIPVPQQITITNTGTGTLSGLAVSSLVYGSGQPTGWLSAALNGSTPTAVDGSEATMMLALAPGVATYAPGSYTATVTVSSTALNVTNSPQVVVVTMTVSASGTVPYTSLRAGNEYACGLATGGAVWCWGLNSRGQLGNDTTINTNTPVAVTGPSPLNFASISSGYDFICGVVTGGAINCWGENGYGQLGNGTNTDSDFPVVVSGTLNFASVSAGLGSVCGVTTQGAAYCWGNNSSGQLGNGSTDNSTVPVAVAGGLVFSTVSVGSGYACGVTTGGAAYCWGAGGYQLGTGTIGSGSAFPVAVSGGLAFASISAGSSTCGVTTGGAAYCWGSNQSGQLGNGTTVASGVPAAVSGGLHFATISSSESNFVCGVTSGGAAYCWGDNLAGFLGNGTTASSATPVAVSGGLTFASVSAGPLSSCGVTTNGAGYCWGDNTYGGLGNASNTSSLIPVKVLGAP
jgi:alpha-tubulin suppressor-like RCC1 family protein